MFLACTIALTQRWSMNKASPLDSSLWLARSVFTEEYGYPIKIHSP
jgi:hypothetical protein